nr:MAG TPA: zinc-ribbon domain protein [Caudoviricetes sp.]
MNTKPPRENGALFFRTPIVCEKCLKVSTDICMLCHLYCIYN